MAAPMAVSSWSTLVEFLSRGSTVLLFFMTGRGRDPSFFLKLAFKATKSTHKLLVLKNLYLETSWKAFSSSSGHCADSRRRRPPVALDLAKCPPFLSASVRVQTSIMKGAPELAKWVRIFKSIVAPKLSELETNMYLNPFFKSLSRVPLPNMAGYKSPCPGGHHSWAGSASQVAGVKSLAVTLGALFCTNSNSEPLPSSLYLERASKVSAEVEKEFMSMNFMLVLNCFFIDATCLAMRSKKLLPSVTVKRDFALSKPMPVPRPPFNFRTTVFLRRVGSVLILSFSNSGRLSTGSSMDSPIMTLAPLAMTPKLYLKAA
mmetsp:Transcript_13455/g.29422  ORF Transcript_13455/g.29422 Transcript_13455/m.29422 type:complete len:317 (-) Transcript_13455:934-1884(-)